MTKPTLRLFARLMLALAMAFGMVRVVAAQQGDAAATTGLTGEVDIQVLQFGVGKVCRPGEWMGVQVEIQDRLTRPRGIILRMAIPDADRDIAQCQVSLAGSAGQKQRVWLYARLPFASSSNTIFEFRAFEELTAADGSQTGIAGRQIGFYTYRVGAMEMAPSTSGLMATVGRQPLGLERYIVRTGGQWNCAPFGHEVVHTISQLVPGSRGSPGELPDRWYGLAQFPVIVWSAFGTGGEPTDLSPSQAEALREWVERGGGHLIIVMPPAGQNWIGAHDNPLASIMPRVAVRRMEGVDLEPYRALLMGDGKYKTRPLPKDQVVHVFDPDPAAEPGQAHRIFNSPDGQCIVARRLVGTGAVTLIGLDLTNRKFLQVGGVETDVFWNRLLGRRGVLPDQSELTKATGQLGFGIDSRSPRFYDAAIQSEISKSTTAMVGILLAFVLFSVYWIFAGPLGFAVLKRKGLSHHGWLSFLIAAGIFTAIAWGGATALRPMTVSAVHLTFLDHVYGQNTQRARSFMSVLLPRYGEMEISVAGDPGSRFNQGLFSWDQPLDREAAGASFPDTRGYQIDGRSPGGALFPARSTTKTVQVDWAGGPRWKMPTPVVETVPGKFQLGGRLDRAEQTDRADPTDPQGLVKGFLMHELPAPLQDVTIVVIDGQDLRTDTSSRLTNGIPNLTPNLLGHVNAFRLGKRIWSPGEVLNLSRETVADVKSNLSTKFLGIPTAGGVLPGDYDNTRPLSPSDVVDNLTALTFYPMLEPPSFSSNAIGGGSPALIRRRATHGLDLGRWFTQPCVIIVGILGDKETVDTCPIPLSVDGNDRIGHKISGRTVIRWVYPLRDAPPTFPPPSTPTLDAPEPGAG